MGSPERLNVLGVGISVLDLPSATHAILDAVGQRRKGYVCVTGVHGVSEAQSDPTFRQILNSAYLCTPDGMPLVWLGKLHGFREIDRVYGPDLMLEVMKASPPNAVRHFFYGGANGVAASLREILVARFPHLEIVGVYEPPFRPLTEMEERELTDQLRRARPDILWVGLSTPKQERFMAEFLPKLDATIMVGVGAAFDFHSGRVRQAPRWIQRSGFEWLYRLSLEPRRLWRRYLKNNPLFVWRVLLQHLGIRRHRLD